MQECNRFFRTREKCKFNWLNKTGMYASSYEYVRGADTTILISADCRYIPKNIDQQTEAIFRFLF